MTQNEQIAAVIKQVSLRLQPARNLIRHKLVRGIQGQYRCLRIRIVFCLSWGD